MQQQMTPQQQEMQPYAVGAGVPAQYDMANANWSQIEGFILRQKTSECCTCCINQPNIDFTLHPYVNKEGQKLMKSADELPTIALIKENASFCGRCYSCCAPGSRATKYYVLAGANDPGKLEVGQVPPGQVIMTHEKEWTCGTTQLIGWDDNGNGIRCPCCCCLPYLETKDANGTLLGKSKWVCDACPFIPKWSVEDAQGQAQYTLRPDVCCGCCPEIKCGGSGARRCRIPFYLRNPETNDKIGDGQISDLWLGFKNECCHKRNMYAIQYPPGATDAMKKTLIGTALLVDITVFEQEQD